MERFAGCFRCEFDYHFQQFSAADKVQKGSFDVIQLILRTCRHALELVQAFSGAIQALSAIFVAVLTWFLVRFTRRYVKGTERALELSEQQLQLLREQNAEQRQSLELARQQYQRQALEDHREEIKVKILEPLRIVLEEYAAPPHFQSKFVPEHRLDPKASASDYPFRPGMALIVDDPRDAVANLDIALYEDAANNHHRIILIEWATFRDSWTGHKNQRQAWIERMASKILHAAPLNPHPVNNGSYVMQLNVALFTYRRLMHVVTGTLAINQWDESWVLTDGTAQLAKGDRESMEQVLAAVNEIILGSERDFVPVIEEEFSKLQATRLDVQRKLSVAIADKTLPERCPFVGSY